VGRSLLEKARYQVLFELESDAVVMIENRPALLEANTAASAAASTVDEC
jgi:hypothetical protein